MTSPTTRSEAGRLLTRRQGLGLLATAVPLGLITACGSADPTAAPTTTPDATAAPDLDQQASADEEAIIALYDAVIASMPAGDPRRPVLLAIRDEHELHRLALAPGSTAATTPSAGGPSGDITVATLLDAEQVAVKSRIRACTQAQDADLARLLAFIGASEAGHVPALRSLA